jgi:hypothetical protein
MKSHAPAQAVRAASFGEDSSSGGARARVLLIGAGDLARRLAMRLVQSSRVGELVLASRRAESGLALTKLLSACRASSSGISGRRAARPVFARFVALDALREDDVAALLLRERPDLVIQCASLLSPWCLREHASAEVRALGQGPFALQLAAQLPIVMCVMRAVRAACFDGPVANCSYPDVTHPVLAPLGLAPTVGIGNVAMIRALVLPSVGQAGGARPLVRVLAHHAHVAGAASGQRGDNGPAPQVYVGEAAERADALAYAGPRLAVDRTLNELSAASAPPLLEALLPGGPLLRTSAPGPRGLPGGYPVRVQGGEVQLDLPFPLTLEAAVQHQTLSARLDGVDSIASDGSVYYTQAARAVAARAAPELGAPLHPEEAYERFLRFAREASLS